MQAITGSVGDGGANNASDTALVQAILVKTVRPAGPGRAVGPYLASYDGDCGKLTKVAISAFQNDFVFVSPAGNASMANPNAKPGQVRAGDPKWTQLLGHVPLDFADLAVVPGGKIVYVRATTQQAQAKLQAMAPLTFNAMFQFKVRNTLQQMHLQHGIAVGVCAQGDRRTFQAQYALLTGGGNVTNAGPGESNHNFGSATKGAQDAGDTNFLGAGGRRILHRGVPAEMPVA